MPSIAEYQKRNDTRATHVKRHLTFDLMSAYTRLASNKHGLIVVRHSAAEDFVKQLRHGFLHG